MKRFTFWRLAMTGMVAVLAACGGGGGGGSSTPPTISNLSYSPTGSYVGSNGGTTTVTGTITVAGANGGVASVTIAILDASGRKLSSTTTPVANGGSLVNGVVNGTLTASNATAGTYSIQVSLTDGKGETSNALSGNFRISPFPWVAQAGMPTARTHAAVVALGSKLYVIGGEPTVSSSTPPPALTTVEVFDAANSSWSTAASLPSPQEYLSATSVGGLIYAFGGSPGGITACQASSSAAVFDPVANLWTALTPSPMVTSGAAIAAVGTSIYLIGGIDSCPMTAGSSVVQVYDTVHDSWSMAATLPSAPVQLGAGVQSGKIVAFGGWLNLNGGSGDASPSQSTYDPSTNAWTVSTSGFVTDGVFVVSDVASALDGTNLYAMGGRTYTGTLEYGLEEYAPATDRWLTKEALPPTVPGTTTAAPVYGPMAAGYGGQLFAFSASATWVYTPGNDLH